MARDFSSADAFAREIAQFQRKLEREYAREIGKRIAKEAQDIAEREAKRDVGSDLQMRGWAPRLETQIKQKPSGDTWLMPTKFSAGPWTEKEKGRNADGGVGLFQGPAANLRTGRATRNRAGDLVVRNRRQRRARRWNGRTQGKGTATRANKAIERKIPAEVEKVFKRQLARHFDVS